MRLNILYEEWRDSINRVEISSIRKAQAHTRGWVNPSMAYYFSDADDDSLLHQDIAEYICQLIGISTNGGTVGEILNKLGWVSLSIHTGEYQGSLTHSVNIVGTATNTIKQIIIELPHNYKDFNNLCVMSIKIGTVHDHEHTYIIDNTKKLKNFIKKV
jgi:hypothetical protein